MAVAEVVVGEAEFFGAEEQRDRRRRQRLRRIRRAPYSRRRMGCCSSRWPTDVVPTTSRQSATASATRRELLGRLEQRRGADRRAGFAERDVVRVDHAQSREAEIRHGAGGGADVQRIARRDHDDAEVVFPVGGDVSMVRDAPHGRRRAYSVIVKRSNLAVRISCGSIAQNVQFPVTRFDNRTPYPGKLNILQRNSWRRVCNEYRVPLQERRLTASGM